MNNIKLKMSMFRPITNECDLQEVYKSDYATFVYVAIRYSAKSDRNLITTPKQLFMTLSEKEPNKNQIKGIKEGLEILEKNDIIYFNENKGVYSIDTENVEINGETEKYFNVPIEYLYKIMEQKRNAVSYLHHYLLLCSTINAFEHTGQHGTSFFADALGISRQSTISDRHKLFVDLGIICFSKQTSKLNKNNTFTNMPKLYTLPEHQDILEIIQERKLKKKIKEQNKAINKALKEEKEKTRKEYEIEKKSKEMEKKSFYKSIDDFEDCPF